MSCNCATSEQLKALYEKFGNKDEYLKGKSKSDKFKYHALKTVMYMVLLLIVPMIFLYVAYRVIFKDGKISLKHFFNLEQTKSLEEYYYQKYQKHGEVNHIS